MQPQRSHAQGGLMGRTPPGRSARGQVGTFLLATSGLLLAACSTPHGHRPAETPASFEDAQSEGSDQESSREREAPTAALSRSAPPSPHVSSVLQGRPAKSLPERRLAQAAAPGRAPVTSVPAERGETPTPGAAQTPVLIYTAQLTMAIFEVVPAQAKIEELSQTLGGFLAQKTNQSITVRVPAARFHDAIAGIEKIGDVTHRDISAEDVSQEFFDLEVRLKSGRAVRERLEHLLARAVKVEDALGIERELDRVVAEIERLEGRLKFLQSKAQYSTVTVNFAAPPREVVTKGAFKLPFPWLDDLGLSRLLDLEH